MRKHSWVVLSVCFLFFAINSIIAQTPDVFRLEYMLMPRNDSGAKLGRIKLVANVPIKAGDSNTIVIGSEYNRLVYDLERDDLPINRETLNYFHVVDLNFGYVKTYENDWRFIGVFTPRLASTLTNPLEKGDFSINATIGVFRDRQYLDKPTRLVFGIAYNSTVALRIPMPVIYFEKRFDPSWSYVIGVPKMGMKYHFKQKHVLQTEFILDGYFINLQNSTALPDATFASSISSSAAVVTFGYSYNITKAMSFYGFVGHTLFQLGVLRDEDRNDIFTLNDDPSLYIRGGFRIGL
ncbi:DUF6268 family outer membrane beta-barrel protein [Maribacter sp. 1_MG-2023]|uniref:DUF6268 family outer membrane beta-barrel protein n=1 Tax=Maribacter sp. 1_MG-2023 TaxID=3062677 RepID=UPI0026E143BB|nr:DUF6268 family outer membrane beta-barrel protein [Maribacter sp. 1_MG-2023]MDO6470500.1 DUF6268 family outer membrane beta-barrel protein [Maribacter sp. 1_MG-2023]